jgi:hypothetical protein
MKLPFVVIQAIIAAGKAVVLAAIKLLKPKLKRPEEKVALEVVENVVGDIDVPKK